MDTPIRLGDRDALDAVSTTLIFHAAIRALTPDDKGDIFNATLLSLIDVQDFDLPTSPLGVAGIHAHQFTCEERSLVATSTCLNANNGIFLIHSIFRQQGYSYLLKQPLFPGSEVFKFFRGESAHLWIVAVLVHLLDFGYLLVI